MNNYEPFSQENVDDEEDLRQDEIQSFNLMDGIEPDFDEEDESEKPANDSTELSVEEILRDFLIPNLPTACNGQTIDSKDSISISDKGKDVDVDSNADSDLDSVIDVDKLVDEVGDKDTDTEGEKDSEITVVKTKESPSPTVNPPFNDEQMILACRYRALGLTATEATQLLVCSFSNGESANTIIDISNLESQIRHEIARIYEELPFVPKRTDSGLAEFCRQHLSGRVEFCVDKMSFACWNENKWTFDKTDHQISRLVDGLISTIPQAIDDPNLKGDFERYVGSAGTAPSVVRILKRRIKQVNSRVFDSKPYLLGVQNGVIDLKTRIFRPHASSDYLTKRANVIYDASATCPLFEQFIAEILCQDSELIRYVQTFLGYLLIGANPERAIFILLGNGQNGKSTLVLVVQTILGAYARSMPRRTLLKSGYIGTGDDLMSMVGYRLLVISELEETDKLAAGKLKSLTGNDIVSARNLYESYQDITIDGKIVILTNEKPVVNDKSNGMWDRMHIVPFNHRVEETEVDKMLDKKLLQESAGILNWMLDGLRMYFEQGLQETTAMKQLKQKYRLDSDPIRYFMDIHYDMSAKETIRSASVYRHYKSWYKETYNEAITLHQGRFNDEIGRIGYEFKRNPHSVIFATRKGVDEENDDQII
ncbi:MULTISPECIES: phage/plasmid primase, P4 family [unclassified Thiocapsa]|uniref:DNA primase family protein n=1 Tax=unclassified Thiocapsa TaxID=2641286 RepID=UPI0035B29543